MNRQRLIGAAVLAILLFVVRAAGAADFNTALSTAAKAILDYRELPCTSVRFVSMKDPHTIDVVCAYDYQYTIDLAGGGITQKEWGH